MLAWVRGAISFAMFERNHNWLLHVASIPLELLNATKYTPTRIHSRHAFFHAAHRLMQVRYRFRSVFGSATRLTQLRCGASFHAAHQLMQVRFRSAFSFRGANRFTRVRFRSPSRSATRLGQLRCRFNSVTRIGLYGCVSVLPPVPRLGFPPSRVCPSNRVCPSGRVCPPSRV